MTYRYEYILAFDPSGNFNEGKGTTGWVLLTAKEELLARGELYARDYKCAEEYWNAHIDLIRKYNKRYKEQLIVVIEEYVLYRDRSLSQTNSKMETVRLLGVMQNYCWKIKQDYSMQLASLVKHRWSDELLLREQILYKHRGKIVHTESNIPINVNHTRDAFRHAIHYAVCRNKYEYKKPISKGVYKNGYYKRSNY